MDARYCSTLECFSSLAIDLLHLDALCNFATNSHEFLHLNTHQVSKVAASYCAALDEGFVVGFDVHLPGTPHTLVT